MPLERKTKENKMMTEQLQKKVERAIKLIQSAGKAAKEHGQPLEICYSGGKDSDVILELAKMSGVDYRAIYKNTTIDPAGTIKHAIDMGAEVLRPKRNFYQIICEHGYPSRRNRFCCAYLKEYKILDYTVVGVRRDESSKRAERYQEPEICRAYTKKEKCRQYLPILDWSYDDVEEFIKERGIRCHALYYDEQGIFHPERRLGCIGCPIASRKHRISEFEKYPNLVKLYIRGGQKYLQTHPQSKNHKNFKNVYEWFTFALYCDNMIEFKERFGSTLFDDGIDCKKYLEQQFNIKL